MTEEEKMNIKCDECDNKANWKFVSRFNVVHFYCSKECALKFWGTKEMFVSACLELLEIEE